MARLAVVSGGGTGIGRAIAERFAKDGDRVVIAGRRGAMLEAAAADVNAAGGADRVTTEVADLADPQDVEAVARQRRDGARSRLSTIRQATT